MIQILECVAIVVGIVTFLYIGAPFLFACFELVLTIFAGIFGFIGGLLMFVVEMLMALIQFAFKSCRGMIKPREEREFKIRKWEDDK